jgi:DNA-binding transcriptional regulator YbjK
MFSFAGCFLIWTLPESPRWLLQEHERNKATESLRILRQTNLIDAELDEIEREETTVVVQGVSICTMFTSTRFRWPLITSIVLNTVQQFSGINTVSIKKK